MGISTDLMQQLNRTFVSQKAEKDFYRKKKIELKNYLYNRFYTKFAEHEEKPPENTFGYFLQTEVQKRILEKFNELDITTRIETYNSILKKVYNQFKSNYNLNYSYENIEKEEAKQQKELEKLQKQYIKALTDYEKARTKYKQVKKQGFAKIAGALFIGGRIASKTYKKMKY